MTTKDQALAENEALVDKLVLYAGFEINHASKNLLIEAANALATPDCRTCVKAWPTLNGCSHNCTNGDQYQPAPAVVLWRTE